MAIVMIPIYQFLIISKINKIGEPMVEQKDIPPDLPFVVLMIMVTF